MQPLPALAGDSEALSALVTPRARHSISSKFKVRAAAAVLLGDSSDSPWKVLLSQMGPDQILTLLILSHFTVDSGALRGHEDMLGW